jgi:hypothetical protein
MKEGEKSWKIGIICHLTTTAKFFVNCGFQQQKKINQLGSSPNYVSLGTHLRKILEID